MGTIREALSFNLRILRADRTQAAMAELIGLPLRSYQRLEGGEAFPQEATLEQITTKLGVSEASLVQLPSEPLRPNLDHLTLLGRLACRLTALNDRELRALIGYADGFLELRGVSASALEQLPHEQQKL